MGDGSRPTQACAQAPLCLATRVFLRAPLHLCGAVGPSHTAVACPVSLVEEGALGLGCTLPPRSTVTKVIQVHLSANGLGFSLAWAAQF